MNIKIKNFTQNFSYTFLANIISTIISIFLLLIVPRFIGVHEYGYWQLYIFYSSYISYMSLGLTDGAYLRYGGFSYNDLPKSIFVSQYWFLVVFNIIVDFSITLLYFLSSSDINKVIVVLFTSITGILIVPRSLLTFMLQATNRIKEFSISTIMERIIFFICVVLILLCSIRKFEYLIYADVIGKIFSVIYLFFVCKELVFGKLAPVKINIKEIWLNISVGIKLLFANLASFLIIGIVRLFIEKHWSIETFGKLSLTLSISNMLMLFINALSVVLFPALRRTSEENLPALYIIMRTMIMIPLLGLLIFYYPAKIILTAWLPQYTESLIYMAILFPMCLYESKMLLLINTYLKTLRKEKLMMVVNIITVGLSVILTYITVFKISNLKLTIFSIIFLLGFRCIIAELCLAKLLKIKVKIDIILEIVMTIIFIVVSWYLNVTLAFIVYSIAYILYLAIKKTEIVYLLNNIKTFLKSNW
ncbi:oligosaccharide flippase family protein [Bacillus smithii]|uniref:oligosaccharide flippase family protein n=1 Tax=Bacillus smithii TaxID=1479 RepID=UPI003D2459B0